MLRLSFLSVLFSVIGITSVLASPAMRALLHDDPLTVVGEDEAVQIEIEPVLHRGAVDLRNEPARLG